MSQGDGPERPRLLAESSSKVYECTMSAVRRGKLTWAQAFARCRRKYESLRASYFALERWEATEEAWNEYGPEKSHEDAYARRLAAGRDQICPSCGAPCEGRRGEGYSCWCGNDCGHMH